MSFYLEPGGNKKPKTQKQLSSEDKAAHLVTVALHTHTIHITESHKQH